MNILEQLFDNDNVEQPQIKTVNVVQKIETIKTNQVTTIDYEDM